MTAAQVTAVVLNWCNEHDTTACVDSLERQDYPALTILLVDNGSPDGSGARLHARYPSAQFLQTGQNLGYAGGNNRGMQQALEGGADYVLVVNNDTVLERSCVRELVRAVRGEGGAGGEGVGAVGAKILRYDAPEKIWFGGGRFDRLRAIGRHTGENLPDASPAERETRDVTFLTGCCLLIPAESLRIIGVFRNDFFAYCEDVEFCLRVSRKGLRLLYAPAARLQHKVSAVGALPSPMQIRFRDRNRRRIVRLHYGALDAVLFFLWFYPSRVALMLRYGLQGELERARAVLKGMTET
jgi:GT2 family glycosyltransferase